MIRQNVYSCDVGGCSVLISYRGIVREDVEGQWLLFAVDEVDALLQRLNSDDGQDWAENLLLH